MSSAVLPQLLELICHLYEDSEGYLDRRDDLQLWYNRGYANGVIHVLSVLGHANQIVASLDPDSEHLIAGQEILPWGKAYLHGWEMGTRETHEVMEVV